MIKIGTNDVGDIFIGNQVVDKIYVGNDLKYQHTLPEEMLVFTGIDANGNYELDAGYDGTAVEYILGDPYYYYKFDLVSPTPTQASDYSDKYVYNETTQRYVQCTYVSNKLAPSWVEVGVTPAYTRTSANKDDYQQAERGTNNGGSYNNMFNYKYFENLQVNSFSINSYSSSNPPPTLVPAIGDIVIPDTYKGQPVTKIAGNAFSNYTTPNTQNRTIWYNSSNRPTSITFGANITQLMPSAFNQVGGYYTPSTFVLNNKLSSIGSKSLENIFQQPINITFESQNVIMFTSNVLGIAGSSTSGTSTRYSGTITLKSNFNCSLVTSSGYSIPDQATYAVISSSVTSITGYLCCQSGSKLVFMHSASDPITLSLSKAKSAITTDIYTDNPTVQNYDWASMNITPTFHPLSEYTGS